MTRRITMVAALVPLLTIGMAFGQTGITGTKHDFSGESWSDGEICKPCHTPHHAIAAELSGRLWNHELSDATYTLHGNMQLVEGLRVDLTRQGGQADMDNASRLCLSCHDGTVALDSYGSKMGQGSTFIASVGDGRGDLGTDLSNDHPVGRSAVYRVQEFPTRYKPIATAQSAGVNFVNLGTTRVVNGETVSNLVVSCISCHDVHNGRGFPDGLLRGSNDQSALCLGCHVK